MAAGTPTRRPRGSPHASSPSFASLHAAWQQPLSPRPSDVKLQQPEALTPLPATTYEKQEQQIGTPPPRSAAVEEPAPPSPPSAGELQLTVATVWAKLDATQRALDAATAELERLRCSKRPGRRLGSGGGDRVRAELAVARVEGTAMACQLAAVRAEAERLKAAVCTAALAEADASSPALGAEAAAARRDTQAALAERDCALAALAALRAELARARQAAPAVARPRHWQAGARKEAAERPARPFLSLAESVT